MFLGSKFKSNLIVLCFCMCIVAQVNAKRSFLKDTTVFSLTVIAGTYATMSDNGNIKKPSFKWNNPLQSSDAEVVKHPMRAAKLGFDYETVGNTHFLRLRRKLSRVNYKKGIFLLEGVANDGGDLSPEELILIRIAAIKNLMSLAIFYQNTGQLATAGDLLIRAQNIAKFISPGARVHVALANNLSMLKKDLGDFDQAVRWLKKAQQFCQKELESDQAVRAILMNNEALLRYELGQTEEAFDQLTQAIAIGKNYFVIESLDLEKLDHNLALMLRERGQSAEAELLLSENRHKIDEKLGRNNTYYAITLINLAGVQADIGKYSKSLNLLERASEIVKKRFGPENLLYVSILSDMAQLYEQVGFPRPATQLYDLVATQRYHVLGPHHPLTLKAEVNWAHALWKSGNSQKATDLFQMGIDGYLKLINDQFPAMNEFEKEKFWDVFHPDLMRFYAFVCSNPEDSALTSRMYDLHLQTKGLLLGTSNRMKYRILKSGNSELIAKYHLWQDQKERLANYYQQSVVEVNRVKKRIVELEQSIEELEKSISSESRDFQNGMSDHVVTWKSIRNELGNQEVAIEIIRVPLGGPDDKLVYVALSLDQTSRFPNCSIIENGKALEQRFYSYYRNAIRYKVHDTLSYSMFWGGVLPHKNYERTFISIDGIYNKINLNALFNPQDATYLIDETELFFLSSTRDIRKFKAEQGAVSNTNYSAELFGYPTFGGSGQIEDLPGTLEELNKIESVLDLKHIKSTKHIQNQACESTLKAIEHPVLLHIATHGFFAENKKKVSTNLIGGHLARALDNPLLKSGLLLCHAGDFAEADHTNSIVNQYSDDNGVLTAYEAMHLDLEGTDVVVLSACETGLGQIKNGEGVYGLQRSFMIAGAKSIVLSLWKVDDLAAQKLMVYFYENWLGGVNKYAAFKQAQEQLRTEYPEPYYWGAFVMLSY